MRVIPIERIRSRWMSVRLRRWLKKRLTAAGWYQEKSLRCWIAPGDDWRFGRTWTLINAARRAGIRLVPNL